MNLDPDSALAQAIRTATLAGKQVWISVDAFSPSAGHERALVLRVDQWSEVRGCRHEPNYVEVVTADMRQELAEIERMTKP